MSGLYKVTKRFEEALKVYESVRDNLNNIGMEDSVPMADILYQLASLFKVLDRPQEAEDLFRQSIAKYEQVAPGIDHKQVAYKEFADLLHDQGRLEEEKEIRQKIT